MRIIETKIADLKPDPRNRRLHNDPNLDAIAESLKRFGQQKPVVVTEDRIVVAGNGMLQAAKRLGWETVQAVVTDLSGADLERFAIADNRTGEMSEWDFGGLLESLRELDGDVPGADIDWLNEIEAIVTGKTFAIDDPSTSNDDTPRKSDVVKIVLWDERFRDAVVAAIREVLDRNPDWKAKVE